jgi:predicted anti-sigma-YlaC factor YlaD
MAEPCRAERGDLAALALGHLDERERIRVQAHVDGCPACRAEYDELRSTTRALPLADIHALVVDHVPPADLPDRILREVRAERLTRRRTLRRRMAAGLAAAAVVLLVAFGAVALAGRSGPTMRPFTAAEAGASGRFALVSNDQGTSVRLVHEGLDPTDVYWLWLTDSSGKRVSAGTFLGSSSESTVNLQCALPTSAAVRVWVTDARDTVVLDASLRH